MATAVETINSVFRQLCVLRQALKDEGMTATAELLTPIITELSRAIDPTAGAA